MMNPYASWVMRPKQGMRGKWARQQKLSREPLKTKGLDGKSVKSIMGRGEVEYKWHDMQDT